MVSNRRDFLMGGAWLTATAMMAGCQMEKLGLGAGGSMQNFALPPMKTVRVAILGLGERGQPAFHRISMLPGVEVKAICDLKESRVKECIAWCKENKFPVPATYIGGEEWHKVVARDDVDVVYVCTPWKLHFPMARESLINGKIPLVEVPAAFTVEECWELVELSEKYRIPAMQLENCCYGEIELLELNLARSGVLGELVHAEGAYIHDLRWHGCWPNKEGENEWRYDENKVHKGNRYPTHGLVPLCLTFGVNRGDRFDYLVSLESNQANWKEWIRERIPGDHSRKHDQIAMGDMNTTLIKTYNGASFMIQHDVSSPRPYNRLQLISGTHGTVADYPFRIALEGADAGQAHGWKSDKEAAEIREKYMHPLWRKLGEISQKVGGHGGMDFIMDLRWAYCLQNGLPLDMDVYDLAATASLCELTEKSVRNRSQSIDCPDFTRGNWRNVEKLGVLDIDLSKLDFSKAVKDKDALSV